MKHCTHCGGPLEKATIEETEEVDGVRIEHRVEGLRCPQGHDSYIASPEMQAMEATRAAPPRRGRGACPP